MGSYGNRRAQKDLKSFKEYYNQYTGGLTLSDSEVIHIQLLLYSLSMKAPTKEDAKKWAEHFKIDQYQNTYVLAGTQELIGTASFGMIPGAQLVDKKFILRMDSTGHQPKHNLYTQLLPAVPKLLKE